MTFVFDLSNDFCICDALLFIGLLFTFFVLNVQMQMLKPLKLEIMLVFMFVEKMELGHGFLIVLKNLLKVVSLFQLNRPIIFMRRMVKREVLTYEEVVSTRQKVLQMQR